MSVKMGPIIDSGHEIKQFDMFFNMHWLLSSGFDGNVILRKPEADQVEYGNYCFKNKCAVFLHNFLKSV